jgi:hypothetical protein
VGLVHNESPDVVERRQDQDIGFPVHVVEAARFQMTEGAHLFVGHCRTLDQGGDRAVAHHPELSTFDRSDGVEQDIDPLSSR